MKLKTEHKQADDSNLIPLINIVFLILIFFLIATVIRPFSARDVKLSKSLNQESLHKLAHTLVIDKTGALFVKGRQMTQDELATAFQSQSPGETSMIGEQTLTIIADQTLPADRLLEIVQEVKQYEFGKVKLVTERMN